MTRIAIINPTTTLAFGERNLAAGKAVAAAGTEIVSITPEHGPASIEGHYDEAVATIQILEEIHRIDKDGIDGYVLACFGDPGIWAAREATGAPVIGIAEASFHMASIVSTKFSVVTTLARTKIICEHLLHTLGLADRCARIRASDLEVLELEDTGSNAFARIEAECREALEHDGSGAIVLGCAGMGDLAEELQQRLQVPVVEGVTAGVKLVESLAALNLTTSKRGDLAFPLAKTYAGRLAGFSPKSKSV